MKNNFFYKCFILMFFPLIAYGKADFSVFNLTCEQTENPLGIETQVPRFSWQIYSSKRNFIQSSYEVLVADSPGLLNENKGNIWNSGKMDSSESILIPFSGNELKSETTYYWKVRIWDQQGNVSEWSPINRFSMGLLTPTDWGEACWISLEKDKSGEIITTGIHGIGEANRIFPPEQKIGMYNLPQFRKEFEIKQPLKQAIAYVSGLGHFNMFLNGKKVSNHFLDPGWTKYDRCALYVPFDITHLIHTGKNAVGVMLGNGFFNIPKERYFKLITSYGAPRLIMKIHLEYTDGNTEDIVTDESWRVSESPITYSSIYGGEDYDANLEQIGWTEAGFNDNSWKQALKTDWNTRLIAQTSTPLTIRDILPTVRLFKNQNGRWVYDLGQNFSGIIHLSMKSYRKHQVKFYPAELLNSDGSANQSASGAPFWFAYTTKENETVHWQPQFTYYGFRYVEIEGAVPAGEENPESLPEILDLKGLHTCNSASEAGTFYCSKPLFNKIYELIDWAIRSNMASVLTDCPHREKLGWLEEAHLMQYSIQYRYNLVRLYEKIMNDMRSTQGENGMIPTTAPELVEFQGGFKDTPEWGSAFIICPWYIYQWYGDTRLITEYYPDMQRYIEYLSSQAKNHIIAYGLGDWFDIGPNTPGVSQLTSNGVTATAIYYYNVCLIEKMAKLLGKKSDAEQYRNLAIQIKEAFNNTFWNPSTKQYDRNSQTANAIAIYMGLTTLENHQQVYENLVADIRGRNNALTAGDVGYRYVLRALESENASHIIYDMNSKYDVPGYGWQLAHGATALTESWQAYGFISNNHFMLGHLMEWFFSGLGGIRQKDDSVAFKHVIIKPSPVGDVRFTRTSYESPYGTIVSDWKDTEESFLIRVEIPANSLASVYLPTTDPTCVTESGIALKELTSTSIHQEGNYTIATIGSGIYRFEVQKKK